ncbi:MAG TPA: hypothetical protein ENI20_13080 [Bacteroides sp.]|nr:hypothetical protein [Bacteroides sp.]
MFRIKTYTTLLLLLALSNPVLLAQIVNPPEIIRVSVDTASRLAVIEWKASTSPDIGSYATFFETFLDGQPGWTIADSVSKDTRKYEYQKTLVDPSISSFHLNVMAIDSTPDGNVGLNSAGHNTMHLSSSYDSCNKTMDLNWTHYVGWGEELLKYEIYYSVNQGPYQFLVDIKNDINTYTHNDILPNRIYCYFIKAIKKGGVYSFSNIICRNISHPVHPAWIDAEYASAVGNDKVELKFVMDPAGEVTDFQLFKDSGPSKTFKEDTVFHGVYDSLVYLDPVLSTDRRFRYQLWSLDVCGKGTESNISGNIVLNASSVGLEAFLSWNPYEKYEAGVKNYRIYRDIDHTGFQPIGGESPDTTYMDDLDFHSSVEKDDEICYFVEAQENEGGLRGNQGFSRSNVACITIVPEIFMANAIIPNAMPPNNQIKPELTFDSPQYLYQVFDRWGNKIFETRDMKTAWDGRINEGKFVTEGAYAYYIKLTTSNGIEVEKTGVITVFYK